MMKLDLVLLSFTEKIINIHNLNFHYKDWQQRMLFSTATTCFMGIELVAMGYDLNTPMTFPTLRERVTLN